MKPHVTDEVIPSENVHQPIDESKRPSLLDKKIGTFLAEKFIYMIEDVVMSLFKTDVIELIECDILVYLLGFLIKFSQQFR